MTAATLPPDHRERLARARLALDGLSIADAFGERFFYGPGTRLALTGERSMPAEPVWHWTDDTAMAVSIVEELAANGRIDRDVLAQRFATRYVAEPDRGYGGTAHGILRDIAVGRAWTEAAGEVFDGGGSMGNGGAMRVAPIGAYFADDLDRAAAEARASAEPTHAHPDGQAGAIAIAVAAACAWQMSPPIARLPRAAETLFEAVLARTPEGDTRDGIARARRVPLTDDPRTACALLGNGGKVISSDTVPFTLWCAARHLDDYAEALWAAIAALGDIDTNCAIVGGIVVMHAGAAAIPAAWRERREPLPPEAATIRR